MRRKRGFPEGTDRTWVSASWFSVLLRDEDGLKAGSLYIFWAGEMELTSGRRIFQNVPMFITCYQPGFPGDQGSSIIDSLPLGTTRWYGRQEMASALGQPPCRSESVTCAWASACSSVKWTAPQTSDFQPEFQGGCPRTGRRKKKKKAVEEGDEKWRERWEERGERWGERWEEGRKEEG